MAENKIFTPHELKTIEVDVEKKIFRVNGEDFGKNCTGFSISCEVGNRDEWFRVLMRISQDTIFDSKYDFDGKKTSEKVNRKPV